MEALAQPTAATYLKVKGVEGSNRPSQGGQFVFAVKFVEHDNVVLVATRARPGGTAAAARPLGVTFKKPPGVEEGGPLQKFFAICTSGIVTVRLIKSTAASARVGTYLYCDPGTGKILTDESLAGRQGVPPPPALPPVAMVLECRPLELMARVLLLAHAAG